MLYCAGFSQNCDIAIASGYPQISSPSCGNNDGYLEMKANSSNGPVLYSLNGGPFQESGVFQGLSVGRHNLVMKDAIDCEIEYNTVFVNTSQTIIEEVITQNSSCLGNTGSITVIVQGEGNLQYKLNDGPLQTSNTFTNLAEGNYVVTVVDNENCLVTEEVEIGIEGLVVNEINVQGTTCASSNGRIEVDVSFGRNLQYRLLDVTEWQKSNVFTGLVPRDYTLQIRNETGCTKNLKVTVDQVLDYEIAVNPENCNQKNGRIEINIKTPGDYVYSINGGSTFQNNNIFNGLSSGNYNIEVRETNTGCILKVKERVGKLVGIEDINIKTTPSSCIEPTGEIIATTIDTGLTFYLIQKNDTLQKNTNGIFQGLDKGSYTVTAVKSEGCEVKMKATVPPDSDIQVSSIDIVPTSCENDPGSITINANSIGGLELMYQLDDGPKQVNGEFENLIYGDYVVTIYSDSGCVEKRELKVPRSNDIEIHNIDSRTPSYACADDGYIDVNATGTELQYSIDGENFQNSGVFDNLTIGNYYVYIKNKFNCIQKSGELNLSGFFYIENIEVKADTCRQSLGSIEVLAQGEDLTYSIDSLESSPNNIFKNVLAGEHTVYIKDLRGCTLERKITVENRFEVEVSEPEIEYSICTEDNANITLNAISEQAELEYSLDGKQFQSSALFTNIPPGTYTGYMRNEFSCTETIEILIPEKEIPVIRETFVTHTSCNEDNGIVEIVPESKSPNLTFSLDGEYFSDDPIFESLAPGSYTAYIKNSADCLDSLSFEINPSTMITIESINSNPSVCDVHNGSAAVHATGGVGMLTYTIQNQSAQSFAPSQPSQPQSVNKFENLSPGTYVVVVKDEVGCITSQEVTVENECLPLLPNTIAPNRNGKNEVMKLIYYQPIQILSYQIMNRWGNEIYYAEDFMSTDENKWWNGQSEQNGLYMCIIEYEFEGKVIKEAKNFTLIR